MILVKISALFSERKNRIKAALSSPKSYFLLKTKDLLKKRKQIMVTTNANQRVCIFNTYHFNERKIFTTIKTFNVNFINIEQE